MNENLHETIRASAGAYGRTHDGVKVAHKDSPNQPTGRHGALNREEREQQANEGMHPKATRHGAGNRAEKEEPDPLMLSFETDLERIRYSAGFRRLAGKCQVFVAPRNDMLRNRLTHALEVAAVGVRIAASTGMNMSLTEAIGTGHDCGHGPGGHAAEEAFDIYLPEGFDHAKWGADETLKPLNLTEETLDGIRQHSWKLDAPSTMEGEIISWSDRIAYVVADWNDAVRAQILPVQSLPDEVNEAAGHTTEAQLKYFCEAIATCIKETGLVGMHTEPARILDLYRKHNYERIYLRPASMEQAGKVVSVLRQLTDYYIDAPGQIPEIIANPELFPASGSPEAAYYAVRYVASMTDRYAFRQAQELLRLHDSELPQSV